MVSGPSSAKASRTSSRASACLLYTSYVLVGAFLFALFHANLSQLLYAFVPVSYTHLDVYKRQAYPRTQPYSRLPYDKRAEKAWWADYYRRNPTLLMRLARRLKAAL